MHQLWQGESGVESGMNLEDEAIYILREAREEFSNPAVLWSMGKDSTTVLYLCRKAFLGRVPFPVIHIDTGWKFPAMYEFRDRMVEEWGLDLLVSKNESAVRAGAGPDIGKLECCTALKTDALKATLQEHKFDALILAIRRDEHGIRGKERVFSPRHGFSWDYQHQPLEMWGQFQSMLAENVHMRVHPILSWREIDVWRYIHERGIPVNPMYFAREGLRYRSLGCMPCTDPVESDADTIEKIVEELVTTRVAERSGRAQDKEDSFTMQRLRALGYM